MDNSSPITIGIIIFAIVSTIIIFINTIITKKWRNLAKDEAKSWKFWIFYYNPLDKRAILPKRTGLGLTFNFAKPISVIITVGLITYIIVYYILSKS